MKDWNHFVHFEEDTEFTVNGPFGYDGAGVVVLNKSNILSIRLDIEAWLKFPAIHTEMVLDYRGEGAGNTVMFREDGKKDLLDRNATMLSDDSGRRRRVKSSIKLSSSEFACSVGYESRNEIDLDIFFNGQRYDFDLIRD